MPTVLRKGTIRGFFEYAAEIIAVNKAVVMGYYHYFTGCSRVIGIWLGLDDVSIGTDGTRFLEPMGQVMGIWNLLTRLRVWDDFPT